MRPFAAPILAAALAAAAQPAPDGLRGQQAPTPQSAPPSVASTAARVSAARLIAPALDPDLSTSPRIGGLAPSGGGTQCRTACANDYYMCLADRDQDVCAGVWSQCVPACPATSSARY